MTDDIVTRLRKYNIGNIAHESEFHMTEVLGEAADEIERLRVIIKDIANAATDEGKKPEYHKWQVNYLRTMWNPLWKAISKAVKEVRGE